MKPVPAQWFGVKAAGQWSAGQRVPAAECAASMRATRYYRRAWELRGGHSPPHTHSFARARGKFMRSRLPASHLHFPVLPYNASL